MKTLVFISFLLASCGIKPEPKNQQFYVIRLKFEERPSGVYPANYKFEADTVLLKNDTIAYQEGYITFASKRHVYEKMSNSHIKEWYPIGFEVLNQEGNNIIFSLNSNVRDSINVLVHKVISEIHWN